MMDIDLDEALERYHQTALRVRDAARTEARRIRKELLLWLAEGRAVTPNRLRKVLDRVCPAPQKQGDTNG